MDSSSNSNRKAKRIQGLFPLVILIGLGLGQPDRVSAHGVKISYEATQALEIQANYDSGEPMANAQVTIYAPNRSEPWLKGSTDAQGRFTFTPDATQSGNWEVKVRRAGHGDILNIPVGQQATSVSGSGSGQTGYTPLQTTMMAAAVIWGFIGTALFFSRRKA
jgi:nickel transport protein